MHTRVRKKTKNGDAHESQETRARQILANQTSKLVSLYHKAEEAHLAWSGLSSGHGSSDVTRAPSLPPPPATASSPADAPTRTPSAPPPCAPKTAASSSLAAGDEDDGAPSATATASACENSGGTSDGAEPTKNRRVTHTLLVVVVVQEKFSAGPVFFIASAVAAPGSRTIAPRPMPPPRPLLCSSRGDIFIGDTATAAAAVGVEPGGSGMATA